MPHSHNMNNQRPTMSHALVCLCRFWPCACWGMSAWARGSGTPRRWPWKPMPWNGNGRWQTAKQTLGEQLWVTYILRRNHADGPQGARFTARKLLEPEIWPRACGISQLWWLVMDMKLRTQHFHCCDKTDRRPLLEVVTWNENWNNSRKELRTETS